MGPCHRWQAQLLALPPSRVLRRCLALTKCHPLHLAVEMGKAPAGSGGGPHGEGKGAPGGSGWTASVGGGARPGCSFPVCTCCTLPTACCLLGCTSDCAARLQVQPGAGPCMHRLSRRRPARPLLQTSWHMPVGEQEIAKGGGGAGTEYREKGGDPPGKE